MKRLVIVAAAAILLTGCTATATVADRTAKADSSITMSPSSTPSVAPAASDISAVFTDSQLFAKADLPDFTVPGGDGGPLSKADYYNALRQYKGGLDAASDGALNTFSNAFCYVVKNGGYPDVRSRLGSVLKLSSLQTLQFSTLIVAQYCPSTAGKIA